jgi:ribose transport system substrate-binding protein
VKRTGRRKFPTANAMRCGGVLIVLSGLVLGCAKRQPPTIVVIAPTGGVEYWEIFNREVKTAASADFHVELAAPQSVTDYTEQAHMVEEAISRHVQGIIVSPSHQLVLTSVLRKAEHAHIPVVIVGAPIALSVNDYAAFIGWDEEEAGRLAGRRLISLLGGKGEVGIVGISPTVEGDSLIEKGFEAEIAHTPQVKLVSVRYGLSDWARGRQAVLDLMTEHPNIRGIFTTDVFSTHAAAYVFDPGTKKRPALIGVSEENNELTALSQGRIDALVISNPRDLGARSMQAMRAALSGVGARAYSTQLPVQIVDRGNLATNGVLKSLHEGSM